jgi:heat shock protein HslJ
VTLTIDGDQVFGTAACNGYGGTLAADDRLGGGGPFRVTELSWTEIGCEPDVMQLEQQYLAALQAVDSYELAGSLHLGVIDVGTSLVFDPVAPVADNEIVGTTWVLDTVIEGDAASNSPIMHSATLTLDDDGTLTGSTGCRLLEGEWITAGAQIVFTRFAAIDDPAAGLCAPESQALDGFIVTVLGDGFTVDIDGRRLTLMAPGDEGLSYTAR